MHPFVHYIFDLYLFFHSFFLVLIYFWSSAPHFNKVIFKERERERERERKRERESVCDRKERERESERGEKRE